MEIYTINEVAERYWVSVRTVYRWIEDGKLRAFKLGGTGNYRVRREDLEDFENRK